MGAAAFIFARRCMGRGARLPWRPGVLGIILSCASVTWAHAQAVDGYGLLPGI